MAEQEVPWGILPAVYTVLDAGGKAGKLAGTR